MISTLFSPVYCLLSIISATSVLCHPTPFVDDPDLGISFEQLIRSRGFGLQNHRVVTEDGYILTVHRILHPGLTENVRRQHLKPVILQHGIMETAVDFVIGSPFLYSKQSRAPYATIIDPSVDDCLGDNLGFDLALTKRYDVWIPNSRGVMQTDDQHLTLSIRDPRFWEYSFDEMGQYDLPAVIDYVLGYTNRTALGFVGFSQGSTSTFVMLSMRPEYGHKIEPFVAMAPVAYLANMRTPLRLVAPLLAEFCIRDDQMLISRKLVNWLLSRLCPFDVANLVCQNLLFLIGGFDYAHLNSTRLPVYYSHLPSPVSNRQLCHFYDNYRSQRFARYDYGTAHRNMAHYRQTTPPDYPLERITPNLTIAFFVGRNDFFSNLNDLNRLRAQLAAKTSARMLPNYVIAEPNWEHLDFVLGTDAGNLVYRDVIQVLDRYTLNR